MNPSRVLSFFLIAILFSAPVATTEGAEQTFYFSGTIDSVSDSGGLLGDSVSEGTAFNGHYTFDPNATDFNPSPTLAQYASTGMDYEYVAEVGGFTFSRNGNDGATGIQIIVSNNHTSRDDYSVNSQGTVADSPVVDPSVGSIYSSIGLTDGDQTAFSSTDLPLAPPDLAPFNDSASSPNSNRNDFSVSGFPASGGAPLFSISGPVEQLVVPEPATLALLGLGGAAMLGRRRRRGSQT